MLFESEAKQRFKLFLRYICVIGIMLIALVLGGGSMYLFFIAPVVEEPTLEGKIGLAVMLWGFAWWSFRIHWRNLKKERQ
jgi:hypothetical protein